MNHREIRDTGNASEWKDIALNVLEVGDTRSVTNGDNEHFPSYGNDPGSLMSAGNEGFDDVSNMYSKLEVMMTAVRQEVSGLESMKSKLKDVGKLKEKLSITRNKLKSSEQNVETLKKKLDESEIVVKQFRVDMQHLNNIYNEERFKLLESQGMYLKQEEALQHAQDELRKIQTEIQSNMEQKNVVKGLKSQLGKLSESTSKERAVFVQKVLSLEKNNEENEKIKTELGSHVWNLTEEIKEMKISNEKSEAVLNKLKNQLVQANGHEFKLKESLQKLLLAHEEGKKTAEDFKLLTKIKGHVLLSDIADLKEVVRLKECQLSDVNNSERNYNKIQNDHEREVKTLESSVELMESKMLKLQTECKMRAEKIQQMEKTSIEQRESLIQKDTTIECLEVELVVSVFFRSNMISIILFLTTSLNRLYRIPSKNTR